MPSHNAVFITGTDTGVGKTLIASALAAELTRRGLTVAVMKPVETGCTPNPNHSAVDTGELASHERLNDLFPTPGPGRPLPPEALIAHDAEQLITMAAAQSPKELVCPYRYAAPVAPAVAARVEGRPIRIDHIVSCFGQLASAADFTIVEGAGGLLVPLTDRHTIRDLIRHLDIPSLVVARSRLGTINHCLLTLEALRDHALLIAGLVINRTESEHRPEEASHPREIEAAAGDVVLGVMPFIAPDKRSDRDYLAQRVRCHIDVDRLLRSG